MRSLVTSLIIFLSMTNLAIAKTSDSLNKKINFLAANADSGSNGGAVEVNDFDIKKFKYSEAVKDVLERIQGSSCDFTPIVGRRALIGNLESFNIFNQNRVAMKTIRSMVKSNQVKAATGSYWDGSSGQSENCSREELNIYFENGKVLTVIHDSNT